MVKDSSNDKVLEQVLLDIEKQFGKGSIMRLGSDSHMNIETTSSGSIALDIALGVGGYPKGRIVEIYGHFMQLQKYKRREEERHLLMLNMHLIRYMLKS